LVELLNGYFKNIWILGQRIETASILWPLNSTKEMFNTSWNLLSKEGPLNNAFVPVSEQALYYIAVCSDGPATVNAEGGVLLDFEMKTLINALEKKDDEIRKRDDEIRKRDDEIRKRGELMEEHLQKIYSSISWKITRPLRGLKRLLKSNVTTMVVGTDQLEVNNNGRSSLRYCSPSLQ
jgi:hypothetical protein